MVKTKHTPPVFLQSMLDDKTFAFVKSHIKGFIAGERVKAKGKGLPENTDLLRVFVKYLSFKAKKWKNIKPESLSTTYPGVGQIYDMLRKRNKPSIEEKQTEPKKKTSVSKQVKQTEESTKKPAEQDQDPVKVQANDDHGVKGDYAEKNMSYRKEVNDDADLDDHDDPSDSSDANDEDDDEGAEDDADEDAQIEGLHWFKEKEFFCDLLDKFTPAELKEVTFSLAVDGDNHQMTVTHLVASHNV